MKEFNPYEAPVADLFTLRPSSEAGAWRDGVLLVMTKDAELPDRCIKCNAPAEGWRLKRKLMWHHQGYYLIVLFNVIIYAIVALIVRQTATLQIPLCPAHRRRRRRQITLAWVLCLLGPVVAIVGASAEMELKGLLGSDAATAVIATSLFAGIGMFIAGLVFAIIASHVVVPQKIDKRYVWLKKVSPELLASLPPL